MNRNGLYLLVGVLAVLVIGLGVQLQHEREKPDGVSIELKHNGISIDAKK